jgi:2-dehydro-3-deoxygalactonokinase
MSGMIVNCDWGTTRLRLRAIRLDPFAAVAEWCSLDGVASLARQYAGESRAPGYRAILADGLRQLTAQLGAALAGAPVLISGMASSSIGWLELPYARLPLPLEGSRLVWRELDAVESDVGSHRALLISGACTDTDVMRGEETELVGLFTLPIAQRLATGSLVVKPGTHSKHLRVESGRIIGFETFMTGELFEVLRDHSVLRHSVDAPSGSDSFSAADEAELRAGLRHARSTSLSAALFRVRTRQLLDNTGGERNRSFLSGLLLGSELAYLSDAPLGDVPLALCATAPIDAHYRAALEELGLKDRLTVIPPHEVALLSARGQALLWRNLGGF